MANRLRGFARMLSTAKNSTRKEGFCRMYSSYGAEKNPKPRMYSSPGVEKHYEIGEYDPFGDRLKEIYGNLDYRTLTHAQRQKIVDRVVRREFYGQFLKILSVVAPAGLAGIYALEFYSTQGEGILEGNKYAEKDALQAMKFKR